MTSHDTSSLVVEQAEPVPCPVCDAPLSEQKLLFEKQGVSFRHCQSCSFEFVNPRPSDRWLGRHYDSLGTEYFLKPDKLKSDFLPHRFDLELEFLSGLRGTLLDVGCMTGSFVHAAREAGFIAGGIDISEPAIRHGRDQLSLNLQKGDFLEMKPERPFDVVTFWASLEHVPNPVAFLHQAHSVLVPGGRLAVSVPNHRGISQRILGKKNRYVCIEHLNYFTNVVLERLMKKCGFEVERTWMRKVSPVPILQDFRGKGVNGASVGQLMGDQLVTDAVKTRKYLRPLRAVHGLAEKVLSYLGLGDLLLMRAIKR